MATTEASKMGAHELSSCLDDKRQAAVEQEQRELTGDGADRSSVEACTHVAQSQSRPSYSSGSPD